jgi:hypothetical protein
MNLRSRSDPATCAADPTRQPAQPIRPGNLSVRPAACFCSTGSGADAVSAKVLRNDATGEYLEVIPELGGKTEGYVVDICPGRCQVNVCALPRLLLRSKRDGSLREVLLDHHQARYSCR